MGTLNRTELDRLERRELQLTILAAAFVLIQAAGLAMFMYPLVFLHPIGNKWTLRASFFGFCALTLLFVSYLLERQRTVRQLKQQLLAELEPNVLNAKRVAVRLQEELQTVRAKHSVSFDITAHNYPEHVKSAHELEDIVKSLLPEQDEFTAAVPAPVPVPAAKS